MTDLLISQTPCATRCEGFSFVRGNYSLVTYRSLSISQTAIYHWLSMKMPIVRACLIRWWNAVCDESRPHGVGSSENRTRLGENSEDEEAPFLTDDVEVTIRPGGNAVQITASFNEDLKGFRLAVRQLRAMECPMILTSQIWRLESAPTSGTKTVTIT